MAFWTDKSDLVEPLRPFRFRIMEAKDYTEFSGSPDDRGYWWWAKSVSKPTYEISKHEYTLINHKFKYPGIASWKDITIKFIDYKDELSLSGPTKMHSFIQYLKESSYSFNSPDGIAKDKLIRNYIIEQLDPDGQVLEKWTLINAFVINIETSELSYEDENLTEITLTVTYGT